MPEPVTPPAGRTSDPLLALTALPGVDDAATAARKDIDALLWERSLRTLGGRLAAESVVIGARDSAAIDGADVRLAALRTGEALDGSPLGRAAAAALAVTTAVSDQVPVWRTAPLQAVAALHAIADRAFAASDEAGRPRSGAQADDPLRLGPLPPAEAVGPRLEALARAVATATTAPALVVAAVVHGELLALRPFTWGSGLVARAAVRLVLASRGVDPSLLSIPEAGFLAEGRPAYVAALRGYATGTPEGVADWLVWHCAAVAVGARRSREVLASLA